MRGRGVHATMPVCYSQIGIFDILIVTVINWILLRTGMGQVVCATEATHISLM